MNEYKILLITILDRDDSILVRVSMTIKPVDESIDFRYLMETETRERLHELLPRHVRNLGPIVEVEEIFDSVKID